MTTPTPGPHGFGEWVLRWWEPIALVLGVLMAAVRVWWRRNVTIPRAERHELIAEVRALRAEVAAMQAESVSSRAQFRADAQQLRHDLGTVHRRIDSWIHDWAAHGGSVTDPHHFPDDDINPS